MIKENNTIKVNRIFIITDTHFGVRSSSIEWLDIMKDYFYDFFIPFLRRNVEPGDILIHCGDLFDNRSSLNLLVLNSVIDIFDEIRRILPVYIILGNHDTYLKSSNDINSVRILSFMEDINVIQEPEVLETDTGKKLFFLPWRVNYEAERDQINKTDANYLFCHLDINLFKFNAYSTVTTGNDPNIFAKYDRVFNGHIHYRQSKNNILLLGCPYQLTRGDSGNYKGIYIFDPNKNEYKFIENKISPKFVKIKLESVLNKTFEEYRELVRNNYVDIITNSKWTMSFPFNELLECVNDYRKINIIVDNNETPEDILRKIGEDNELINFDIVKFSNLYIDNSEHSDKLKNLLKQKILELYNVATKNEE